MTNKKGKCLRIIWPPIWPSYCSWVLGSWMIKDEFEIKLEDQFFSSSFRFSLESGICDSSSSCFNFDNSLSFFNLLFVVSRPRRWCFQDNGWSNDDLGSTAFIEDGSRKATPISWLNEDQSSCWLLCSSSSSSYCCQSSSCWRSCCCCNLRVWTDFWVKKSGFIKQFLGRGRLE